MTKMNQNYNLLNQSYLFSEIAKRVNKYSAEHPNAQVIRMGIGDVTLPLAPVIVQAMHAAVDEMGEKGTFRGYGPEQGYDFLREAIQAYYATMGVSLQADDVFISDGAKSDLANCTELFSNDNCVMIPDPVYPVYVDSNLMMGRKIIYMDANEQNGFLPMPCDVHANIVYLCSPNNPTGAAYSKAQLQVWVDWAIAHHAVLLFDAAYESFITDDSLPRSIYQIPGAEKCAIEFCSFSKTAGFTGTRCGYTVIPQTLERDGMNLRAMWLRRQTTKFNGVPYIVQRGAQAVFSQQGRAQIKQNIAYYMTNARLIADTFAAKGIYHTGGVHSPYIWLKCEGGDSWAFFNRLLEQAQIVGTPGAGFGKNGEGFFRLTGFSTLENTQEAMRRLQIIL